MNLVVKVAGVLILALVPSFADSMPVQGAITGTFTNLSAGTGSGTDTWLYDATRLTNSSVNFTGDSYGLTNTPLTNVELGTLTIRNALLLNNSQNLTATLTVNAHFTTPTNSNVPLGFTLGMDEDVNMIASDQVIDLSNFVDKSAGFTFNGETYTVHLDGFFLLNGPLELTGPVTTYDVLNSGVPQSIFLMGDITSAPAASAVPEPGSIVLMSTMSGLVAFCLRKRKKSVA
jgi:hypothetical protein